ncbi:DUF5324 family protein [Streptomyces gobiensis]|uniref:DUF5324 family protein n=1 Tax=Streptomyces gobiensis TaxID=2875706 RepID=UPI001E2D68BB|nr:DUF5324 family protein [Streptomyces gobiensis]UGY92587.1 DUF5324 family protein [Streptomyces gobiensis]
MTRKDSVRAAKSTTKDSVRHALDAVAPRVSHAARQAQCAAQEQYEHRLAPRISHARQNLPSAVDHAATRAAEQTLRAARQAAEYTAPRMEAARVAAGPAREEALARSTAALAALRGEVTPAEVRKLSRKRARRARNGRVFKRLVMLSVLTGVAVAAWRWWDKQANPDWLVEPPAPTEVDDRSPISPTEGAPLEAEVETEAKTEREEPH